MACRVGLGAALLLAAIHAGTALAAHVARLDIRPAQVAAGGEVSAFGPPGWAPTPVSIRWNSFDQVLGTFPATRSNSFDYRAPPSIASRDDSVVVSWDDTELGDDVTNTQDLMAARIQLTALPGAVRAAPGRPRRKEW